MLSSYEIVTPAQDISLLTVYEAKLALGIPQSTSTSDDQIELMIKWASAEIAVMCNRVFAKETIVETFDNTLNAQRLFLSHYPVLAVTSVTDDGDVSVVTDDFTINSFSGILNSQTSWSGPTVVAYTGGYELPYQAPPALAQAALLLTKEAYYAAVRGDASIRMVSHKDSRVMYFDPNAQANKASAGGSSGSPGAGTGSSPAHRAVSDLLRHFMRFEV